jgi:hypothetical protein
MYAYTHIYTDGVYALHNIITYLISRQQSLPSWRSTFHATKPRASSL